MKYDLSTAVTFIQESSGLSELDKANIIALLASIPTKNSDLDDLLLGHCDLSTSVFWYKSLLEYKRDMAEKQLEETYERAKLKARDILRENGESFTKDILHSKAVIRDDYKEAYTSYNRLKSLASFFYGLFRTIEHRKDCLVQLSANNRQEHKADMEAM